MKLLDEPLTADAEHALLLQNSFSRQSSSDQRDHELDHKYCRSPLRSNSGLSSDEQVYSPPLLDSGCGESTYSCTSPQSVSSDPAEMSPNFLQQVNLSPLPTGVEDLNMLDFNFETLDPSSLLQDDDFLRCISEQDATINFSDLGELWTIFVMDHFWDRTSVVPALCNTSHQRTLFEEPFDQNTSHDDVALLKGHFCMDAEVSYKRTNHCLYNTQIFFNAELKF